MNYQETLNYLFNALPLYQRIGGAAYKATLENAGRLDDYFDYPHKKIKTIHVAGTNGKGSVCHIISSVFQAAGYTTGLYTSPHLFDFRERIKVNGIPVSKEFVIDFTLKHKIHFDLLRPSFFEMSVFMAFEYFLNQKTDIAIIETGLGGRLDATNVIRPEISVITNIAKDHTQLLGDTLIGIAKEKAGIIKKGIPIVIGETQKDVSPVFQKIASRMSSPIFFADQHYTTEDLPRMNPDQTSCFHFTKCLHWDLKDVTTDIRGQYQQKNLITSLMTLALLTQKGYSIPVEHLMTGLMNVSKNTGLLGRWYTLNSQPLVICDAAHNPAGFKEVLMQIENTPYKNLRMVLGFVSDKALEDIFKMLPKHAYYYFCQPDIPRAKHIEEIGKLAEEKALNYTLQRKVTEAYEKAKFSAEKNDLIFIGGSTYVISDLLEIKKIANIFLK